MHPQVRWVFTWQIVVAVIAAVTAGAMLDWHAAVSALLGGGIGVASGGAYVWRAMRAPQSGLERDPSKAFRAQVAGEGLKFAVTLLLFALVFKSYGNLAALPLFLSYASTFVVYWAALLKNS